MSAALQFLERSSLGWAFAFVLGSLVGSFLNVVIARLPAGISIAWPGSRCPSCETPIKPHHNIPLLGWLMLRGRCAACGISISARYPTVELITACLFVALLPRFGLTWTLLASWAFAASLVAVTFIDLDIWEIPDEIVLWGLPIAMAVRPLAFDTPWYSGLVGAGLGAGFLLMVRWAFFALRGVEAMGLGDVKLIGFIGAFLGAGALLPTVTLASMSGAVVGGLLLLVHSFRGPATEDAPSEDALEDDKAWAASPSKLRLGLVVRAFGRRMRLGVPEAMAGRTHLRLGFLVGGRGSAGRSGWELSGGLFQDVPGWGHFEGLGLGKRPFFWLGPVVGARLPDVEASGDEADWTPPPTAVPFGPFLSLGALATLLLSPLLGRWARLLGP